MDGVAFGHGSALRLARRRGFGAEAMGYAPYFLLTFFLSFPAYALLPWVKRMLARADARFR